MGIVASVQRCPGHRRPMEPLEEARLRPGGMEGDAHFGPDSTHQLLLLEVETLRALELAAGTVKENLTLEGVRVMGLAEGTRLAVGDALVEITSECRPCSRMDEIRGGLRARLEGVRGMYARVVEAGAVRPGDPVHVLEPAAGT